MQYRPKDKNELRTPVKLLIPTGAEKYNGVNRCIYPSDGDIIFVACLISPQIAAYCVRTGLYMRS